MVVMVVVEAVEVHKPGLVRIEGLGSRGLEVERDA